jgi:hypothetical protein
MLELFLFVAVVTLLATIWQHYRYWRIRRDKAQDRQRLLHSTDAFHLMVFFRLRRPDKLVETCQRFTQGMLSGTRARLIYAGQSAFTENSHQLHTVDWDGVLLFEYPSRTDFERRRSAPETIAVRALFAESYFHGMRRNRKLSGLFPLHMLRRRLLDTVTGHWRPEPLQPSLEFAMSPEYALWRARVNRLSALHEVYRDGAVVFNLVKYDSGRSPGMGTHNTGKLLSRMAALSHGPLHIGRCVALEEFARFDRAYITFYPSARYLADLLGSQHFLAMLGQNKTADLLRVPTVPITNRL